MEELICRYKHEIGNTAQRTIMSCLATPATLLFLLNLICIAAGTFMIKDLTSLYFYSNGHADEYTNTLTLCASMGGSPPAVHSEADVDFMISIAKSDETAGIWLGADKKNDNTFKWSDNSAFDYASWTIGQPSCPTFKCSLILIAEDSRTDRRKMKAVPVFEKNRQICKIDLSDDVAIEKAYLSTLRNESGFMRGHDAEQLIKILFDDEISSVRTLVSRMKAIKKVASDAGQARSIACVSLVLTAILAFVVVYVYRVQNSYLHIKQLTSEQRDVND